MNHVSNFAIGARVTLYNGENKQVKELFLTRGYLSSVEPKLNFGLGDEKTIERIEISWPDQKVTRLR
ncbi:MAG: hypothetical protein ACI865_000072 [Flavobacteriaceae bacterium]|jgi:hypothetical protein